MSALRHASKHWNKILSPLWQTRGCGVIKHLDQFARNGMYEMNHIGVLTTKAALLQLPPIEHVVIWVLLIMLDILVVFAVVVLLRSIIGGHIRRAKRVQDEMSSTLEDLRATASRLTQLIKGVSCDQDPQLCELKDGIERIDEELRYMSPSADRTARSFEIEMKAHLGTLNWYLEDGELSPSKVREACDAMRNTLALIAQRKVLHS